MQAVDLLSADPALTHALTEQLEATDLLIASFPTIEAAAHAWRGRQPTLLLLDAALVSEDEERRLSALLATFDPAPRLLFLGTPRETGSFARAEIFPKPLRLGVFLARLRLLQNKGMTESGKTYRLGPWLFLPDERLATRDNEPPQRFTEKETALLAALCATAEPLAKEELLADVWGYDASTDTHTLETHLYKLRRKLAPENEDPFVVEQGFYALNPAWRPA